MPDKGQFRLSCTWVVWFKEVGGKDVIRARLVARGFEERLDLPKDSPTVDKDDIRLCLSIAAGKGWKIKTSDVKSAFLQGEELERNVFLKPPREMEGGAGHLMKLRTALYGLSDASLQWYKKLSKEIKKLGCFQSVNDPAVYYCQNEDKELEGICTVHVDDLLHAGTKRFGKEVVEPLKKKFKMGKTEEKEFTYVGLEIKQDKGGIEVAQRKYVQEKIKTIDVDICVERKLEMEERLTEKEGTLLRKIAGRIGWLSGGSRPDMSFPRVEISTKFKKAQVRDLVNAGKVVRQIDKVNSFYMIPAGIGKPENWELELYCDAAFGNMEEKSAGGYILFVKGGDEWLAPISWSSNVINKVVTSPLAAEILAMEKAVKEAVFVREVLEEVLGKKRKSVRLEVKTDSESLVDAIHGNKPIKDKRMRRYVAVIQQALSEGEIRNVSWKPSEKMLADPLTKKGADSRFLIQTLQTGKKKVNEEV